jgi:membrane-associated protease RseP (regulator of RpoE activity)
MGFEEVFVFAVAGCVAIYHQRSQQQANKQTQIFVLWILAVALPSLAIALTTINRAVLPLTFVALIFLLSVWIYSNSIASSNSNLATINLDPTEEKQLKDCFLSNIYHLTGLEYRPHEIFCRGNLRSQNPKYAYETINQNIQKIFGDRFTCYLQESHLENLGLGFGDAQDRQDNTTNYCFYLIPNYLAKSSPASREHLSWLTSAISILVTTFTVLVVGANQRLEDLNFSNLQQGIPYLLCLVSIFIARSIAQYYISRHYRVQLARPLFLPVLGGFGLLGSLNTNFPTGQGYPHQRRILFDLAVIPAIVGLAISIVLLILGNWLLVPSTAMVAGSAIAPSLLTPNLAAFDFKNSILVTLLQTIFSMGKAANLTAPITSFSPLTLAGWSGLAISALQLMPFDLLDGGNLVIAMFGHRQAVQIARISRLVLLAIAVLTQPWLRIYSLLLFLLPTPRPLILNESIEIGKARDLIGMILIAIALLIILPIPKALLL